MSNNLRERRNSNKKNEAKPRKSKLWLWVLLFLVIGAVCCYFYYTEVYCVTDNDGDHVFNCDDKCPNTPGEVMYAGCKFPQMIDSDNDKIIDFIEIKLGTDHQDSSDAPSDKDDDRLPDELDPSDKKRDKDGDGISDFLEYIVGTNMSSRNDKPIDADEDGAPDELEIQLGWNTNKKDTDNNGFSDGEELNKWTVGTPPPPPSHEENPSLPLDTDGDGILDINDQCPNDKGPSHYNGCPDTDGDGVHDGIDQCKREQGPSSNFGCPEKTSGEVLPPDPNKVDSDNDGTPDINDQCAGMPGIPRCNGCPDADGDGFCYPIDTCDNEYSTTNNGCPEQGGDPPHKCMTDLVEQAERDVKTADGYSSRTSKRVEKALKSAKSNYQKSLECNYIIAGGRDKVARGLNDVNRKLYQYYEAKGDQYCRTSKPDDARDAYEKAKACIADSNIKNKLQNLCN